MFDFNIGVPTLDAGSSEVVRKQRTDFDYCSAENRVLQTPKIVVAIVVGKLQERGRVVKVELAVVW